tara:strand:+ start:141446 stop:141991 length:546 start_codon:yes stop_codon:yes gene_type:complete
MTQDASELFEEQGFIINDQIYSASFIQKLSLLINDAQFDNFIPPELTDSHMQRCFDKKLLGKLKMLLINAEFNKFCREVFHKEIVADGFRLTKYTRAKGDFLSFHGDEGDIRLAGFSIDFTQGSNSNSCFQLRNEKTKKIILSNKAGVPGRVTIFKISPELVHGVTPTDGDDRIAITGWLV